MTEPINATVARMIRQANSASASGDHAEAQRAAREAVQYASRSVQHRPTRAAAHYTLAAALWADENASMDEAREHAVRGLELATVHTDEYYLAMTLLARIDAGLGNLESARALNENLLDIYTHKNRRRGIADVLRSMGDLALKENNLAAAREYFQQGLAIYESGVDDPLNQAGLLLSLGTLAYREGAPEQAQQHWDMARSIGEMHHLPQVVRSAQQGLDLLAEITEDEP